VLVALGPVSVDPGGRATVEVKVDRKGNAGPIQVTVSGAPEGVAVKPLEIPADKTAGPLELTASEKLGDKEQTASLKVTAKVGSVQAEQTLAVTVKKLNLPSFAQPAEVLLQPGGTKTVDLTIQRNGHEGPLQFTLQGVPAKVTATVADVAAGQSGTNLKLAVAADAPDVKQPITVATTVFGRTVQTQVPLQVVRSPFRVDVFRAVVLRPGEKMRIEVPVERTSYKGPLELEPTDLPEGVTITKTVVAPDKKSVALEIVAAENAKERVKAAKVVSKGGHLSRTDPLIIRVSSGERGFLPKEITSNPELFPLLRRGSFGGRLTTESKQALLDAYGGTPESEEAVMRGLRWLAIHQQPDGRWPLKEYDRDIDGCDCRTKFEDEVLDIDAAGTAFGLLAFLGAGVGPDRSPEHPKELAKYQKRVRMGLSVLVQGMTLNPKDARQDGRLHGNMYAHAAGTIALCEAYGLTEGEKLKQQLRVAAQRAIKHIIQAQHKPGGGWRYSPGQPGDMSALTWQFLALRSAQLAGITIERGPLTLAERFVDSCQAGPDHAKGSRYSYMPGQEAKLSLSAAGLLTRQYLGWRKDTPDLEAGCKYLMENLPPESAASFGAAYYFYHATQVLHHMEGSDFDLWNYRMREHLIRTQEKQGHKAGSWNPEGVDWAKAGGRLYATSLALMTLQVYYRHLPLYRPILKGAAAAEP
jgi:hypothetical protein